MKTHFEMKFEILLHELENLQSNIRNYDTILFGIKGWAITIVVSIFAYTVSTENRLVLVGALFAIICFWILDALFKGYQRKFILRYNKIEHYLRRNEFKNDTEKQEFSINIPDMGARVSVKNVGRRTNPFLAALYPATGSLYFMMILWTIIVYFII